MDPTPFIERILDDEGLTNGLDERAAMVLVEGLVQHVRALAARRGVEAAHVESACRRGRQMADIVCVAHERGEGAGRLKAESLGITWPADAAGSESLMRGLIDQL